MIDNSIYNGNNHEAEAENIENKISVNNNKHNDEENEEEDEMAPFALSIHTNISSNEKSSSQILIDSNEESVKEIDIISCSSSFSSPEQSHHSSSLNNNKDEDVKIRLNILNNDDSIIAAAEAATEAEAEASNILQYDNNNENLETNIIRNDSILNGISSLYNNNLSTEGLDFSQLMKEADNTLTFLKEKEKKQKNSQKKYKEKNSQEQCYVDDNVNDRLTTVSIRNQYLTSISSINESNNAVDVKSTSTSSTPMKSNVTFHASSSSNPNIHHRRTNLFNYSNRLSMGIDQTNYKSQKSNDLSSTTLMSSHTVSAVQIEDDIYKLQVWIPQANINTVIETVSNIDLLRLWCDPVLAAVVTKESERANLNREYDGEWIEAATTLRSPSGGKFGLYNFLKMIKTYLGFPNHGHLTLFIERKRGQVSLTIGPLGGYCEVLHTLTFQQCGLGVNIVDCVKVNRENISKHYNRIRRNTLRSHSANAENYEFHVDGHDHASFSSSSCSFYDCFGLQRKFLPTIEDHVNQTMKSLKNLKNLIEHGEIVAMDQLHDFDVNGMTPLLAGNLI